MGMTEFITIENNIQKTGRGWVRMALSIKHICFLRLSWLYDTFLEYLLPSILKTPFNTNLLDIHQTACLWAYRYVLQHESCWNTVGLTPGTNKSSDITFSSEIRNKHLSFNNLSFLCGTKIKGILFYILSSSMQNIVYIKITLVLTFKGFLTALRYAFTWIQFELDLKYTSTL